jgi:hypothetical protein
MRRISLRNLVLYKSFHICLFHVIKTVLVQLRVQEAIPKSVWVTISTAFIFSSAGPVSLPLTAPHRASTPSRRIWPALRPKSSAKVYISWSSAVERVCVILSFDLSIGGINGGRRLVTVGKGQQDGGIWK